ncbi:MAG: glutamate--tRNA ligase family protein, partial [Acidobacteriota bacterium]|nr:glutamate--tRNA ligase family protein [Acidobacteriota bacterium]
ENNRELYDWVLEQLTSPPRPEQTEFARLVLNYTVLSKRKLIELVRDGHVNGWDDPRMPTLSGLRRRGVPASALRTFCGNIGVARANSVVDVALLEHAIRDDLNLEVKRVLAVLRPLKVVIENWPEDRVEELDAPFYPRDVPKEGSRKLPFSREIYIERDDFHPDPPKKFFRLAPGREVRLRYGYIIRCERVVEDPETGEIVELRCTYDPETRGGHAPGRKVKGTIHWVSADHAVPLEVRLYDRLFTAENPDADKEVDFKTYLNPESRVVLPAAVGERWLATAEPGDRFQFERQGYFYYEPEDSIGTVRGPEGSLPLRVFNRIVTLRDTWAKIAEAPQAKAGGEAKPAAKKRGKEASPPASSRAETGPPPLTAEEEARAEGYRQQGLSEQDSRTLAQDPPLAAFYEEALEAHSAPRNVANWLLNDLLGLTGEGGVEALPFGGGTLGEVVALVDGGTVTGPGAKQVLEELVEKGGEPAEIVRRRGLEQLDDAALEPVVAQVLEAHPDNVELYRGGKTALLGFFVGQVMKATRGRANPQAVQKLLRRGLDQQ